MPSKRQRPVGGKVSVKRRTARETVGGVESPGLTRNSRGNLVFRSRSKAAKKNNNLGEFLIPKGSKAPPKRTAAAAAAASPLRAAASPPAVAAATTSTAPAPKRRITPTVVAAGAAPVASAAAAAFAAAAAHEASVGQKTTAALLTDLEHRIRTGHGIYGVDHIAF